MSSHNTSTFTPAEPKLVASAEFEPFAPASCSLFGCMVPEALKKRTFMRAYDTRMETNQPIAPLCCILGTHAFVRAIPRASFIPGLHA